MSTIEEHAVHFILLICDLVLLKLTVVGILLSVSFKS